jgi:hypothetical protein
MRPGDLPAKEGEVFAIKKFKPDKEGESGAREIMVRHLKLLLIQKLELRS